MMEKALLNSGLDLHEGNAVSVKALGRSNIHRTQTQQRSSLPVVGLSHPLNSNQYQKLRYQPSPITGNLNYPHSEIIQEIENLLEVIRGRQPGKDSVKGKKLGRAFTRELSIYFRQLGRDFPFKDLPGYLERNAVKEAITPDEEALRIAAEVTEEMTQRLDGILRRNTETAYLLGATQAHEIFRIEPTFALIDDSAIQWMNTRAARMVTKINETTRMDLARILTKGAKEGQSVQRLARSIRKEVAGMADISRGRALTIANTELNSAMSEASLQTYTRLNVAGKSWATVGDDNVSEDCQENEAAGVIPMNASFPGGTMRPPQHPDCRCTLVPERSL